MNVVALDRAASSRLRPRRDTRPKALRRVVTLPGTKRMGRADLEPTRLVQSSDRASIEIDDAPLGSRWDILIVLGALGGFLLWWLGQKLAGTTTPAETGRELRVVFERLGGLWIKVGQLMSLRRDVLHMDFCDELARLQNRAIGFPPEKAIRRIEDELGAPIDKIFSVFDPIPFAAASLSQVHAARLRKKDVDVAVKVLRPGIEAKLKRDMRILRNLFAFLSYFSGAVRKMRLKDALFELEDMFEEETDYRYEISNMKELRRTTRGHKIYIPRVFEKHSTQRVIVMEWISGALMSDYIRIRDREPARVETWLKANNIDPEKVGKRILISFMRQLFENNLFHADLHPGNIVLLRNSRVALIDLGTLGSLDREFLTLYRGIQRAIAEKDFGKAADLQLRLCAQLPPRRLEELRMELSRCLRTWSNRTRVRALPFRERSVNTGAAEVSRILGRYGVQQTWDFLKIARTLSTLDGSLEYLYSGLNYVDVLQSYFRQASGRAMRHAIRPSTLARGVGSLVATVDEYQLLLGPAIRSSGFSFEGTISKLSQIGVVVTKVGIFFLLMFTLFMLYEFMTQHHDGPLAALENDLFNHILIDWPELGVAWWSAIILSCGLLLLAMRRIVRELMRPDPYSSRRR